MQQRNVLEYLEKTVKEVPSKVAFENKDETITFEELYTAARGAGSFLLSKGYSREPVLIYMEKSPSAVAAFMGCIYAGCFYVPLDEEMPKTRINHIFDITSARVLICDKAMSERAVELGFEGEIFLFDDMRSFPADDMLLTEVRAKQTDTDPIYIVFTSGSTGVPKGVVACHRSVIDYIENLSAVLKFDRDTRFGNQSPFYFDACLKEIYPTMKFGASTVIVPRELFMFPVKLSEFIVEKKINTVCWVVTALTMISSFNVLEDHCPSTLRTVAFGSEVFPVKQFNRWKEALPEARFVNLYGPTEATGMSCWYEADRFFEEGEAIPIGRPFENTEILLIGDDGKKADEGEIYIRGTAVTLGYYNDPEKTAENFIQNPLQTCYPELVYKTGDIAKLDADGNLVFVSRKDHQIKRMGHRIELGEIEADAALCEGISSCCAVYHKEKDKIVLFFTGTAEEKEVKADLKERLPRYMLPGKVVKLDKMPLTPNGKRDRKYLEQLAKGE